MAKRARELAVKEKRERKRAKKAQRLLDAETPTPESDPSTPQEEAAPDTSV